jgi:D-beta-D-heptose 7-phosphate kinase/D-beta-D-heptose 1-phosphate adenosyltransferase
VKHLAGNGFDRTVSRAKSVERSLLDSLDDHSVVVIGDMMLDCYLHGHVERISPEAPVPVIRRHSERQVPGGAANVASNLAALGMLVQVVGVTGQDEARTALIKALKEQGRVSSDPLIIDPSRPTVQKMRVVSAQQQIVRIDIEDSAPLSTDIESSLIAAALSTMSTATIVVGSDYGKGVLSDRVLREVIGAAQRLGKTFLIDPKRRDWSIYRGATILTPNRRELFEATGLPCETDAEAEAAVARAREMCDADILLTRSEKGMSFYRAGNPPIHVPTVARDVFDVSGAGDTVIAVLAAGLALEMDIIDILKMANHAAGIVVAKLGTATVTRDELRAHFLPMPDLRAFGDGHLLTWDELVAVRREWAEEGLTVGLANGCFDLVHPGHIALIRQATAACDRLVVALNSDASVRRLKGPMRPVQDERARAEVIGAIKGVSAVTLFDEDTPLELLQVLEPDVLIKGADYSEDQVVGADLVKARGGRVILAELVPGRSTTKLIGAAPATRS